MKQRHDRLFSDDFAVKECHDEGEERGEGRREGGR